MLLKQTQYMRIYRFRLEIYFVLMGPVWTITIDY